MTTALFVALVLAPGAVVDSKDLCKVTFKDGFDCSGFKIWEYTKEVNNWPWQERQCKIDILGGRNPDSCLWQGCVAEQNLTKGAIDYYYGNAPYTPVAFKFQADYCKSMGHCTNTEFQLPKTTVAEADAYCDRKFGDSWRHVTVGFGGYGPPLPGSGLWECAHSNFQCDWAYCNLFFCDKAPMPPPNAPIEMDTKDKPNIFYS
mmetsp:Transcript_78706/g.136421  ORF Transcript_78706/g.136421 Transcript_78706/m.136421 type:complete len:203 (+) Transcript_78706:55-663(+)